MANDSAAKKRPSVRSERRVQLATLTSKTLSPLKHSQRTLPAGTTSSTSTSRPVKAKVIDTQTMDKSKEMKNEDGSGSGAAELDKSSHWIQLTQYEHRGLRELVEFLESLDTASRHVPSEIQNPDELLATAKVINMSAQLSNLVLHLVFFNLPIFYGHCE